MVNLDKLAKGTDWILEERKVRRKNKAKQSKHVARVVDEEPCKSDKQSVVKSSSTAAHPSSPRWRMHL